MQQPQPQGKTSCLGALFSLIALPFTIGYLIVKPIAIGIYRLFRWWINKIRAAQTGRARVLWVGGGVAVIALLAVMGRPDESARTPQSSALPAATQSLPTGAPAGAADATAARVETARASDPTAVPTLDATAARRATAQASDPTATIAAAAAVQRPTQTRAPATATRRPSTPVPTRPAPSATQAPSATRASSAAQVPTRTVPPTAVPPTAVPPTAVPPTAEPTAVPPTAVPTAVPPTAEPPTAVPPTAEPTSTGGGDGGPRPSCGGVAGIASAPNTPINIVRVDKSLETVTIVNNSGAPVDLTGWYICSQTANQLHAVLSGTIAAGEEKLILSQAGGPIWLNNSPDPALLVRPDGSPAAYYPS